jgi:aryl-alcohol dehydrogenase-like predicted oxidoreductase
MDYRQLGASGLRVPVLSFGTGTFGGRPTPAQMAALDAASDRPPPYPDTPYRQQEGFARLNPPLV